MDLIFSCSNSVKHWISSTLSEVSYNPFEPNLYQVLSKHDESESSLNSHCVLKLTQKTTKCGADSSEQMNAEAVIITHLTPANIVVTRDVSSEVGRITANCNRKNIIRLQFGHMTTKQEVTPLLNMRTSHWSTLLKVPLRNKHLKHGARCDANAKSGLNMYTCFVHCSCFALRGRAYGVRKIYCYILHVINNIH